MISCLIAGVPLFGPLEDYFVNGIHYPINPLFVGSVTKSKHLDIFEEYYGRLKSKELSWKNIGELAVGMFSDEYDGIVRNQVHFYGNAGVCLFKYFVTPDDPQSLYVWFILSLNITCFAVITVAYIVINFISTKSSNQFANCPGNKHLKSQSKRLQRKVSLIIVTDFCCWIPFIIMCFLHSMTLVDGSPHYSLFSIVVLPINSIINPLLYDETMGLIFENMYQASTKQFTELKRTISAVIGEQPTISSQKSSRLSLENATKPGPRIHHNIPVGKISTAEVNDNTTDAVNQDAAYVNHIFKESGTRTVNLSYVTQAQSGSNLEIQSSTV